MTSLFLTDTIQHSSVLVFRLLLLYLDYHGTKVVDCCLVVVVVVIVEGLSGDLDLFVRDLLEVS